LIGAIFRFEREELLDEKETTRNEGTITKSKIEGRIEFKDVWFK
jgi:ABC-type bacteriocin/lantibiotic exporter with double-glycine peptidase domain